MMRGTELPEHRFLSQFDMADCHWLENLKGRDHLEDMGIDGKIFEWILGK